MCHKIFHYIELNLSLLLSSLIYFSVTPKYTFHNPVGCTSSHSILLIRGWQREILDRFRRKPPIERLLAHVPPKPRLLHAAKRRVRVQQPPAVNRDLATLQRRRDALRTADVVGEDGGAEAVLAGIGLLDDLRLGGELRNRLS